MKSKKIYKRYSLRNDLDWLDPDQELTLEKDDTKYTEAPSTLRESLSLGVRSILAIVICIVIPALWYFDWSPSAVANSGSEFVTDFFKEGDQGSIAPLPPVPDIGAGQSNLDMNMIDYAAALNEEGLLEKFSSPAVGAFYENNVTVDYLIRLRDAGLVDNFSFPAVIAFFENQIPFDYLSNLKTKNLLEDLSFPAIITFYQNDITIDYLNRLKESGFLESTSFPAVVAYFNNNVTVDFLNQLKERGLLEKLSFPDVVNMYENN